MVNPRQHMGVKATGAPVENAYLYEDGGLFGRCDGPKTLVNAMVGPIGIEGMLTWTGTNTEREFVDALTAIVETGAEQSTPCNDCVKVQLRACSQFFCFGRFCRQTEELQFDRLGVIANAGVPLKTLFGNVTDANNNIIIPNGSTIDDAFMLQSRAAGYALRLKNATMIWTGNPSNNNGRVYQEFGGLQLIVNTGKFDAYTQADCDALDPFLMNMNHNGFTSDGTYAVRHWFARAVQQLERRAQGAGMDWNTAVMMIAMNLDQWECVARQYACAGIDLCSLGNTNSEINASADQALARYEDYLTRSALPINGRWYPVVIDTQIPQTYGQPGGVCSDIYFLTKIIDGQEVLYGQYQDFLQTYGRTHNKLMRLFNTDDIAFTDNGRFAVIRSNSRGCFDIQLLTKPRLVNMTSFLNARITNVCCNSGFDPFPTVTASGGIYPAAGGRRTTPVQVLYGEYC